MSKLEFEVTDKMVEALADRVVKELEYRKARDEPNALISKVLKVLGDLRKREAQVSTSQLESLSSYHGMDDPIAKVDQIHFTFRKGGNVYHLCRLGVPEYGNYILLISEGRVIAEPKSSENLLYATAKKSETVQEFLKRCYSFNV